MPMGMLASGPGSAARRQLRHRPSVKLPGAAVRTSPHPTRVGMIGAMTTRRGLFVAPFDPLADPRVVGDLAATAEAAGWGGFFLLGRLQYGEGGTATAAGW